MNKAFKIMVVALLLIIILLLLSIIEHLKVPEAVEQIRAANTTNSV